MTCVLISVHDNITAASPSTSAINTRTVHYLTYLYVGTGIMHSRYTHASHDTHHTRYAWFHPCNTCKRACGPLVSWHATIHYYCVAFGWRDMCRIIRARHYYSRHSIHICNQLAYSALTCILNVCTSIMHTYIHTCITHDTHHTCYAWFHPCYIVTTP